MKFAVGARHAQLVLAAALCVFGMATPAAATIDYRLTDAVGRPGGEATISLVLDTDEAVAWGILRIQYDAARLTFVDYQIHGLFHSYGAPSVEVPAPGQIEVGFLTMAPPVAASGALVDVVLAIPEGTAAGEIPLTLVIDELLNPEEEPLSGTAANGRITVALAEPGSEKWRFHTGDYGISSSPAVDVDGTIYFGVSSPDFADQYLFALNPDGTEKWRFPTGPGRTGAVYSSPAIGPQGTIYVGIGDDTDGYVYAISPDGNERWRLGSIGAVRSSPAIGRDGTIYAASWDGHLYAVDPSGAERWKFQGAGALVSSPAIGASGTIYVGGGDAAEGRVYALGPDGTEKWTFPIPNPDGIAESYVYSSPAIGPDGTVYLGSFDNHVYALHSDGSEKWRFKTGAYVYSSPSVGSDGTIYVGSHDGNLYALDPDGSEEWHFATGDDVYPSPAVSSDGTVFVGSQDGNLYALDPDGGEKWRHPCGNTVVSSAAIAPDGTVYVGTGGVGAGRGDLLAINASSGGLADSAWPMFHRNLKHTGAIPARVIQAGQFDEIQGFASDGVHFWITARQGSSWQLFRVSSVDGSTLASYDVPFSSGFEEPAAVGYRDGTVYVRVHPRGPIYAYDGVTGARTTTDYSTRIWSIDMAFAGATLWQANDDAISNRFEIYDQSGHEFPGPVPGRKSIASDGTHLYVGDYGDRRVWKLQVPDGPVIAEYAVTAPAGPTPFRITHHNGALWTVTPDRGFAPLVLRRVDSGRIAFAAELRVAGNGSQPETLTFGLAEGAADGIDAGLGEAELPPLPPNEIFDVRFQLPGSIGSTLDLRNADLEMATWTIRLQAGQGGYPLTFAWDPDVLPGGSFRLQDGVTGGDLVDVNLSTQSSYELDNAAITSMLIVYGGYEFTHELAEGWSMVSLPCEMEDASLGTLFPTALSLFRFGAGYRSVTEMSCGLGYWINLPAPYATTVSGPPWASAVVDLPARWSMVGPGGNAVDVASLRAATDGNLVSVFGFNDRYYQAETMEPGGGYWVNLAQPGQLDLSGAAARPVADSRMDKTVAGAVLWVESQGRRQKLRLGVDPTHVVALPPVPPAGMFDARVEMDRVGAWQVPTTPGPRDYRLRVQGQDLRLGWEVPPSEIGRWQLIVDGGPVDLLGAGTLILAPETGTVLVRQVVSPALPQAYALEQNYPNPFNPETAIRYALPEAAAVRLRVYGVAGQLVRELVRDEQPAGRHRVVWDGRDRAGRSVANGVYLCELRAGPFRTIRRMAMMK